MYVFKKSYDGLDAGPLIYWMRERQRIYRMRENSPNQRPFTKDKILQTFRFCNVFRELDKTTAWIRRNWREPNKQDSSIVFAMGVARMFNDCETLKAIGYPKLWNPEHTADLLSKREKDGHRTFSPAYIISPCGSTKPKIQRVIEDYLTPFHKTAHGSIVDNSLKGTWELIRLHQGFGPFMAYEVVSDLRWTPRLQDAVDIYTWANPGPGAKRGINRLLGEKLTKARPDDQTIDIMRKLLGICRDSLGSADPMFSNLEMRDIEHSLCETDKYLRVKLGEGRPKEMFR